MSETNRGYDRVEYEVFSGGGKIDGWLLVATPASNPNESLSVRIFCDEASARAEAKRLNNK